MAKLTAKEIEDQIITHCAQISFHLRKLRDLEGKLWRLKKIVPPEKRKPRPCNHQPVEIHKPGCRCALCRQANALLRADTKPRN